MTKYKAHLRRRRHKLVQQYEQRCADRINGRSGVVAVKVAPGGKPGYRSMSKPEGDALYRWVADFRRTVADISHLLKG